MKLFEFQRTGPSPDDGERLSEALVVAKDESEAREMVAARDITYSRHGLAWKKEIRRFWTDNTNKNVKVRIVGTFEPGVEKSEILMDWRMLY